MQVTYESKKLEKKCTKSREMRMAYPDQIVKPLQRRMKQIESATSVADLQAGLGSWHPLTGRGPGVYAAKLSANYRLVVRFSDVETTDILAHVLDVGDYH